MLSILLFLFITSVLLAQNGQLNISAYDGVIIAGYVDQGAFVNFMGPNINTSLKKSKVTLGMLPSLRFKNDKGTPKNSFVTPNLGVGLTFSNRCFAIQIPCYYNSKTFISDGYWQLGIGLGLRLNELKNKN